MTAIQQEKFPCSVHCKPFAMLLYSMLCRPRSSSNAGSLESVVTHITLKIIT